jgi:hypothetical protein
VVQGSVESNHGKKGAIRMKVAVTAAISIDIEAMWRKVVYALG